MPKHVRVKFENGVLVPLDHAVVGLEEGTITNIVIPDSPRAVTDAAGGENDSSSLARVTHELFQPLVAARGAVWMAQNELGSQQPLRYPYLEDALGWLDLLTGLVTGLVNQLQPTSMRLQRQHVVLNRDVIAPSVRQLRSLLNERRFSAHNILSRGLDQLPPLFVDRELMAQLFFNLIGNSIKYSFEDSSAFSVEISAEVSDTGTTIRVRDWGIGVPPGSEEKIFEEGFRGTTGASEVRTGLGRGLWVARQIAQLHSGRLVLTRASMPTEFSLVLPTSAAAPPIAGDPK